jgi:hypothetical protein
MQDGNNNNDNINSMNQRDDSGDESVRSHLR